MMKAYTGTLEDLSHALGGRRIYAEPSAPLAGANAEILGDMARKLLATADLPASGRLIIVGDIHGCYAELVELLARVAPRDRDRVVSVGDIVMKGPAAAQCLDLWRERRYLAVRGNNEIKLLAHARPLLRDDLLDTIAAWPLVIDFPRHRIAVVHGGFLPQMEINEEEIAREQEVVPELRWIRRGNGDWKAVPKESRRKDDVLWSEKWRGDRFVVYGHTPLRQPKFDECALGLDTGCVYGGSLTAAIYDHGEWTTVSVPAKRQYAL